jgi:hypothetical protein
MGEGAISGDGILIWSTCLRASAGTAVRTIKKDGT